MCGKSWRRRDVRSPCWRSGYQPRGLRLRHVWSSAIHQTFDCLKPIPKLIAFVLQLSEFHRGANVIPIRPWAIDVHLKSRWVCKIGYVSMPHALELFFESGHRPLQNFLISAGCALSEEADVKFWDTASRASEGQHWSDGCEFEGGLSATIRLHCCSDPVSLLHHDLGPLSPVQKLSFIHALEQGCISFCSFHLHWQVGAICTENAFDEGTTRCIQALHVSIWVREQPRADTVVLHREGQEPE
mmetsp:Transcript_64103/g.114027  ORF Transcript_64103/g.114027 Transcript_64103/m.114027 type:complete len:243 (-) Transcript_64103:255-983(-)